MLEEAKIECLELLEKELQVLDRVKVLLALCKAQMDTQQLYDGFMQAMRLKSYSEEVKLMPALNLGIYDLTPEQIYKQIEDIYQNSLFKVQRDNKKTITLLGVQGNSSTGCLGQGDLTQCTELQHLQMFKNRKILSIACGEHHVIVLVSGCSCINPYFVNQCKGKKCNVGNEVFGWGENFMGQITMNDSDGNFISTPHNINQLSGKNIIGVHAFKSTSIAWDQDGKIYQWGAKHMFKIDAIPDISQIVLGMNFGAVLSQKQLFIIGQLNENITYNKLTKLDQNIDQIACGNNHLIALNSEGQVWGLGSNNYHQLGENNTKYQQLLDEECFYIHANENSTVMVTCDGEVLYCGQVGKEKIIEYPKTLQIDEDIQIIQACAYDGQIYALNLQGKVFKWDIDKEPKTKTYFTAPIRQLYLCRGIRLCESTVLQGEWCRIEVEEEDQEQYETFTDINLIINLGDKYGPYGIKQTHPIRYNLFVTDEDVDLDQLLHKCQVVSMSKIQSQQENKIYLNFMNEQMINKAIIEELDEKSKHKLILQIPKPGTYQIYLYLNEQLLIDCPLTLNLIAGNKQEELLKAEELKRQQQLAEQQRKQALLQKKQQEEEDRQRMLREQQQEIQQKQNETKKRADDAYLQHQQKLLEEKRAKDEERQLKKDLLTGGGFDLNKAKLREQQQQQQQLQQAPQKIIKQVNPVLAQKVKQQIQTIQQERIQQNNQAKQISQQQTKPQSQPPKLNPVKATPKVIQSIQSNKTTDKAFSTQETFKEFQQTGQFRKTDTQLQRIQQELQQEYQNLKRQETNKYKR